MFDMMWEDESDGSGPKYVRDSAFENEEINDPEEAEELTCSEADEFRERKIHNLRAQTAKKKEKRT